MIDIDIFKNNLTDGKVRIIATEELSEGKKFNFIYQNIDEGIEYFDEVVIPDKNINTLKVLKEVFHKINENIKLD